MRCHCQVAGQLLLPRGESEMLNRKITESCGESFAVRMHGIVPSQNRLSELSDVQKGSARTSKMDTAL